MQSAIISFKKVSLKCNSCKVLAVDIVYLRKCMSKPALGIKGKGREKRYPHSYFFAYTAV